MDEFVVDLVKFFIECFDFAFFLFGQRLFEYFDTTQQIFEEFFVDVGYFVVAERTFVKTAFEYACGDSYGGGIRRYVFDDDGVRTYFGVVADGNVSQHFRTRTDDDVVAYGGVAFAFVRANAAECDLLVDKYVISDYGRFADDDAYGVIDKNASSDFGSGVDVHHRQKLSYGGDEACKKA
jgi:hypothetical protein